jgi:pantetheine-phosphate adenylyltransferase
MSVASRRAEKYLPALQTFVIDVISPTSSNLEHDDAEMLKQTKMSSTFIREWIVNNQNKGD